MPPAQPPAHRLLVAVLAAAAIALLGGCSDGTPVRERSPIVRVTLDEYEITPQDISVPAGRVQIVARDVGRLTHNLRVEIPPATPEDQAQALVSTPTAHPGETVRATVTLRPGTYRIRCSLANHDDLGMYGTLTVR